MFGSKCKKGDACPYYHEKKAPLSKEEKKQFGIKKRSNGDLIEKCKEVWNELRLKELEDDKRKELMKKLMILTKGKISDIALKHDSSRIIQCMVKYSTPEQSNEIYNEIYPHFLECVQSKHGSFLAISLIRHATKEQLDKLLEALKGHIYKLSLQQISSKVIEYIFDQKLSDNQAKVFIQEVYLKEYVNFPQKTMYHLSDLCKDNENKLKKVKERLRPFLEKAKDKGLTDNVYIHFILSEYIKNSEPKEIHYMTTLFNELYPALLVTEDGSYSVVKMIGYSTAKDRKIAIKTFKDQIKHLIVHPFSYKAIMKIMCVMDDTVYTLYIIIIIFTLISSLFILYRNYYKNQF